MERMERIEHADPAALVLERSALLSRFPFLIHGVTRRMPGLGRADGNLGYSGGRDREDAWAMRQAWCAAAGVDPGRLVASGQAHGANVIHVTAADAGRGARPETQVGVGDAMIANEAGPVLLSLHADCLPIIFVDPGGAGRGPAVGVAHAGWRGTVGGVAPAAVGAMARAFGTTPGDLHVWLGPSIGGCCYEVGAEVVDAWRSIAGEDGAEALRDDGERTIFDLRAANRLLLMRAGVSAARIEISEVCTRCAPERWFSHRAQGAATGRFGAIVALRGCRAGA
jgi:polyphenol oxidase